MNYSEVTHLKIIFKDWSCLTPGKIYEVVGFRQATGSIFDSDTFYVIDEVKVKRGISCFHIRDKNVQAIIYPKFGLDKEIYEINTMGYREFS